MNNDLRINVCVCTYLRTAHLKKCLISLINQNTPKDASYAITVIDNDKNQSAESIVSDLKTQSEVTIRYVCEQQKGIPFARNRALDESLKLNFDYIAFIDDDEYASCSWLSTLFTYLSSYSDPVVIHGRVVPRFPEDTPRHMCDSYSTKKERRTGTKLNTCATNNVIFPTIILKKLKLHFDISAPFAGGTDTKFFFEVNKQGVLIYECAEAIVYETVFPNRLKMSWIMHRKYRTGITTAWVRMREGRTKSRLIVRAICKIFSHTTLGCFNFVCFNFKNRNKHFFKVAKYVGILAGVKGIKVESYKNVDG